MNKDLVTTPRAPMSRALYIALSPIYRPRAALADLFRTRPRYKLVALVAIVFLVFFYGLSKRVDQAAPAAAGDRWHLIR